VAVDFDRATPPRDLLDLFGRVVRAFSSVSQGRTLKTLPNGDPILLASGADGVLVPHGQRPPPKSVQAQIVGTSASSVIATVGAIDQTHVRVYATGAAQAHLILEL
jgi:hypothetical protein